MSIIRYCRATFTDHLFVVRYLTLGLLGTLIHFGGFWALYELLEVWYLAAAAGAFLIRYVVKFFLVRSWLFGTTVPGRVHMQAMRFTVLEAGYLFTGLVLMAAFVELLAFPPFWALVLSSFMTSMSALVITRYVFGPAGQDAGARAAANGHIES